MYKNEKIQLTIHVQRNAPSFVGREQYTCKHNKNDIHRDIICTTSWEDRRYRQNNCTRCTMYLEPQYHGRKGTKTVTAYIILFGAMYVQRKRAEQQGRIGRTSCHGRVQHTQDHHQNNDITRTARASNRTAKKIHRFRTKR